MVDILVKISLDLIAAVNTAASCVLYPYEISIIVVFGHKGIDKADAADRSGIECCSPAEIARYIAIAHRIGGDPVTIIVIRAPRTIGPEFVPERIVLHYENIA